MKDERLQDSLVVASVSGGKDSAALSLWLTEQGLEHRRVFADTGWEHNWTYEYLRGTLTEKLGPISEVQSKVGGMREWVAKKGMFPSRLNRYCTSELKVKPIQKFIESLQDEGYNIVNAVGIRAGESDARAKMSEWEWNDSFDCWTWRPLIDWNEEQVIAMHTKHGLRPNPLYLAGATRVGCWPCIFSRKSEVKLLSEISPERIDVIRKMESEVHQAGIERYAKRGETFESLGYSPPTFFHSHSHAADKKGMMPIDEYVDWSKTSHGGRQYELIDDAPEGCVRWGLCDSAKKDDEE
jgi:3'-phosphoadenosine 5'-phosphosulfate sulfotransferase (PAPS reductase)/FAD synthetase